MVPASKVGAELLLDVISTAYERTSLMVTGDLPFESWTEVLGSERLTPGSVLRDSSGLSGFVLLGFWGFGRSPRRCWAIVGLETSRIGSEKYPLKLWFHRWARQGSNLRPRDYESPALTTELRALPVTAVCRATACPNCALGCYARGQGVRIRRVPRVLPACKPGLGGCVSRMRPGSGSPLSEGLLRLSRRREAWTRPARALARGHGWRLVNIRPCDIEAATVT